MRRPQGDAARPLQMRAVTQKRRMAASMGIRHRLCRTPLTFAPRYDGSQAWPKGGASQIDTSPKISAQRNQSERFTLVG